MKHKFEITSEYNEVINIDEVLKLKENQQSKIPDFLHIQGIPVGVDPRVLGFMPWKSKEYRKDKKNLNFVFLNPTLDKDASQLSTIENSVDLKTFIETINLTISDCHFLEFLTRTQIIADHCFFQKSFENSALENQDFGCCLITDNVAVVENVKKHAEKCRFIIDDYCRKNSDALTSKVLILDSSENIPEI